MGSSRPEFDSRFHHGSSSCRVIRAWNRRGNEDFRGNENRKSREKIFSVGKKSTSIFFFQ